MLDPEAVMSLLIPADALFPPRLRMDEFSNRLVVLQDVGNTFAMSRVDLDRGRDLECERSCNDLPHGHGGRVKTLFAESRRGAGGLEASSSSLNVNPTTTHLTASGL